jgi:GTP-binding protein
MDSNDLERERGITILAKATSVDWKDTRINIVDTPGHADFGGEVERILNMVDGAIVLVDAAEGPMPQTKFVVGKALKVGSEADRRDQQDRPSRRPPRRSLNEVFDLFANLDATDEQLDFPILYGSGRDGWMNVNPEGPKDRGMAPLLDLVLKHVPPPTVETSARSACSARPRSRTPSSAASSPAASIPARSSRTSRQGAAPRRQADRDRPRLEDARLPRPRASADRRRRRPATSSPSPAFPRATVADTLLRPVGDRAAEAQPIDPPTLSP